MADRPTAGEEAEGGGEEPVEGSKEEDHIAEEEE